MSAPRDLDRQIQSFLAEGPMELPDASYDEVRDRMEQKRQRAFIGPWRTPDVNNFLKIGLGAAAVVIVAFVGFQLISDPSAGDQSPSPSASSAPTAAQSAGPSELPLVPDQPLSAGTYSLADGFPVGITFEVPEGWVSCSQGAMDQGVCKDSTDTEPGSGVGFVIVDNVVADPCGPASELLDPPVGPSVDDLVAAISSLEGFEATASLNLTVDGFSGKQFTVTAPEIEGCGATWATSTRTNGVGPGEINMLRILDVDGVRVVISGAYQPAASEEQLAAIQQVIDSVHIEP